MSMGMLNTRRPAATRDDEHHGGGAGKPHADAKEHDDEGAP